MRGDQFDVLAFLLRAELRTRNPHGSGHHVYVVKPSAHVQRIFRPNSSCQTEKSKSIIIGSFAVGAENDRRPKIVGPRLAVWALRRMVKRTQPTALPCTKVYDSIIFDSSFVVKQKEAMEPSSDAWRERDGGRN